MENQPRQKETSAPPHFPLLVPLVSKTRKEKKKQRKRLNKMPKHSKKCDSQTEENGVPEAYANLKTRTALRDLGTNNNAHQRARGTRGGLSATKKAARQWRRSTCILPTRAGGRGGWGLNTHQNRRPVPVMIDTRNIFQPTPIHIPRINSTRLRNASARYLVVSMPLHPMVVNASWLYLTVADTVHSSCLSGMMGKACVLCEWFLLNPKKYKKNSKKKKKPKKKKWG